jgi:hypothetical protein
MSIFDEQITLIAIIQIKSIHLRHCIQRVIGIKCSEPATDGE